MVLLARLRKRLVSYINRPIYVYTHTNIKEVLEITNSPMFLTLFNSTALVALVTFGKRRTLILMVAIMKMTAFCDIAPYSFLEVNRRFRGG